MVEQSQPSGQQGVPFLVLLFQLPEDESLHRDIQDRFFGDGDFWQPHIGQMIFWTKPFALTMTESPEGEPLLALFVEPLEHDKILYSIGKNIAEELDLPAFTVLLTYVDEAMGEDLKQTVLPWEVPPDA